MGGLYRQADISVALISLGFSLGSPTPPFGHQEDCAAGIYQHMSRPVFMGELAGH